MTPLIITSPLSEKHDTGNGHPECAARTRALKDLLETPAFEKWELLIADRADDDQILAAHDAIYLYGLQDQIPDEGYHVIDGDTILSPDSFDAALYTAGAACMGIDEIMQGENKQNTKAFCLTRPPGHHAEPNTAMGFCFFNNVFIAARHAQTQYDIKKIAIIDFDVHHGNGTDTMTRRHNAAHTDAPIFYISTHAYPLFPMTGTGKDNTDHILNIPLAENFDSDAFRTAYTEQVFPVLNDFAPELVILSAGFDAHKNDPLAPAQLEIDDFDWLTRELVKIADTHANGRILSVLEGGYNIATLTNCVRAHLLALKA